MYINCCVTVYFLYFSCSLGHANTYIFTMNIFLWAEQYNSVGSFYAVEYVGTTENPCIQKAFNNKFDLKTTMSGFSLMQIKEWIYKPLKNHDFNRNVKKKFFFWEPI